MIRHQVGHILRSQTGTLPVHEPLLKPHVPRGLPPEIDPHEEDGKAAGLSIDHKLLWYLAGYALLGDLNRPRCFHLDLDQLTLDVGNRQFRFEVNAEVLVLNSRNPVAR